MHPFDEFNEEPGGLQHRPEFNEDGFIIEEIKEEVKEEAHHEELKVGDEEEEKRDGEQV